MRKMIKDILTDCGYSNFIEAENGVKGVDLFESEKPDLVISDLIMPLMDGIETLKKIMSIDNNAKVLMITAVGQESMKNECKKSGAIGYIPKPFTEFEVQTIVKNILPNIENTTELIKQNTPTFNVNKISITPIEIESFQEILSIGVHKAITALSKMTGQTFDVTIPFVHCVNLSDAKSMFGDENMLVTTIDLSSKGNPDNPILVIFPNPSVLLLADILMKRKIGTTKNLSGIDESAIKEVGNIVVCNCLSAMSDFLEMNFISSPPYLLNCTVGVMLDKLIRKFDGREQQTLACKIIFVSSSGVKIHGNLLISFSHAETQQMLNFIQKKIGGLDISTKI